MTSLQLFSTDSLGNWLKFQTSTGSFGSNYTLSFPPATDTAVYETYTQNISNKTFTSTTITDSSNTVTAKRLATLAGTGFDVVVNGTTPSGANRVLVTTSATAASWITVPNAALSNSSITINTTSPGLTGGGVVSLGGSLTLVNGGVTGITYGVNTRTGTITLVQGSNISIVDSPAGTFTFSVPAGAGGVSSLSGGTTGLLPNAANTGALTLSGQLSSTNGGTGVNNGSSTITLGGSLSTGGALTISNSASNGSVLAGTGAGTASWTALSSLGVTSFSAGTTGLTPSVSTTGSVTLAGTLIAANGGTGFSSYAVGDILYANTTTTLARLADVATGNALLSGGINTAPLWGKVGLTTAVTGILPVANGGTALSTTPTNGQLLIGNGTNYTLSTLTAGTGVSVTNGAGSITLSLNSSLVPVKLSAVTTQISVGGAATPIGYVPWQNSLYSSYTTRTVIMWVIPSSTAGKNLTVSVNPDGGASIGSLTINGGAAVGAIYTFTFTAPGVDTNLQIIVSRTGGAGSNPLINGITISLA